MTPLHNDIERILKESIQYAAEFSPAAENMSSDERNQILNAFLYPIRAGGKRVRPTLTCLIAQACGVPASHPTVLLSAAAVELIHTYSLVHDDLPCMDNDDLRRGKPTTHKVFGEAQALLVGDALLTHAFHLISRATEHGLSATAAIRCVEVLSRSAGPFGMIAGQWKDLAHTNNNKTPDWKTLCGIHNLKTGVLLGAACAIGAIVGFSLRSQSKIGTIDSPTLTNIAKTAEELGVTVGLAFQIIDDILDVTQNSHELGKTAGKDAAQDKLTAVKILGLEGAEKEARRLTEKAMQSLKQLQSMVTDCFKSEATSELKQDSWTPVAELIRQLLLRTS